ncbi:hypothetical protein vseg_006898 [Gypsophila vaccaria]
MADVKSAAQWIGKLLADEAKYLAKVGENIKELQDELEWMHCFLKDADASQLNNSIARKWVAQIREFAYEAEDTVEKFVVDSRGRGPEFLKMFKKYSRLVWKVIALHKIGKDIDALKDKMAFLTAKLHTYGIKLRFGDSSDWISKANHVTYFSFEKEELVDGREVYLKQLLHQLVHVELNIDGSPPPSSSNRGQVLRRGVERDARVFSICGEGGIGKTFLANEIYHHPEIRRSYNAFAWASISQPCQISAIQQELLSSLTSRSREQIAQMSDDELKDELRKVQRRKKCFIVLDGFWEEKLWDQLKEAFPIRCHRFRSKILLTTRLEKVAKHVDHHAVIHNLSFLTSYQSELLLARKLKSRGDLGNISGDDRNMINDLKRQMLTQCGGLPLAIAVLGGILSTKSTLDEWKDLKKNFDSYSIDREEKPWKIILDLSYYELPYQLKPCFLYMGYFPTNLKITTTKLSRLWEAEGLVSSGDNEESEETLEDVAESCLAEMVERSLVQVASRDLAGRAKTCRLHNVIQKLCMDKAMKLDWLNVVPVGEKTDQPSGSSSKSFKPTRSAAKRKSRRLAIYCAMKLNKLPVDRKRARYVRSLLFFNTLERDDVLIPLEEKALKSTFNRYKLLRVLDIENIGLSSLPKEVGYLIHLRYLSLRGSWVSKLPSSIRHLRFLQTLDLRVLSFVRPRIPNVLSHLESLVHLYLPAKPFILRKQAPNLCLRGLEKLETLSNFSNMCKTDDVGTLTNLREFSSCNYLSDPHSILPLLGSPSSALVHLEYISLRLESSFLSEYPSELASCKALRKLWVRGNISETIRSVMLPENIVKLTFLGSEFLEDPMPVLEKLSKLKQLSFEHRSFKGTHMSCSEGGFQELRYLDFEGLENLTEWTVKEGAMPKLLSLEISRCHKLQAIPDGLRSVKSLRELKILYMPLSFYGDWTPEKSLDKWHEYRKVEHVPRIDIAKILDIQQTNPN